MSSEKEDSPQLPLPLSKSKKRKLKRRATLEKSVSSDNSRSDARTAFGKFVVYVDESGDHGMERRKINPQFPVFCLAFCIFYKSHYCKAVIPAVQRFKFRHFGHDQINLHEAEIRNQTAPFDIFPNRRSHELFMLRLGSIMEKCNFILIANVIEKLRLPAETAAATSPYIISLRFCMENLYDFLSEHGESEKLTHIIAERRGPKEDREVELEFLRICAGQNRHRKQLPFKLILIDKTRLSTGLQLADLVARPVALSVLRPTQPNKAFEILKKKFYCRGGRNDLGRAYEGTGLGIFPPQKVEGPR